jgi:hypothetical protein
MNFFTSVDILVVGNGDPINTGSCHIGDHLILEFDDLNPFGLVFFDYLAFKNF